MHEPAVGAARRDRAPARDHTVHVREHPGPGLLGALVAHVLRALVVGHPGVAVRHAPAPAATGLLDADDLEEVVVPPDGGKHLDGHRAMLRRRADTTQASPTTRTDASGPATPPSDSARRSRARARCSSSMRAAPSASPASMSSSSRACSATMISGLRRCLPCSWAMQSFTSNASEWYIALVRALPSASMRLVWNRMSGSTTAYEPCAQSAAISALAVACRLGHPALAGEPAQHLRLQVGAGPVDVAHVVGTELHHACRLVVVADEHLLGGEALDRGARAGPGHVVPRGDVQLGQRGARRERAGHDEGAQVVDDGVDQAGHHDPSRHRRPFAASSEA